MARRRTGDPATGCWPGGGRKALGVLFAVGAVSGTILSFEMGMLWPGLMGSYGQVIGLPFAIEGIAFFIEAIFLGIYLYGVGSPVPSGAPAVRACRSWRPGWPRRSSWSPRTRG